jgi:hypothetical protein
MKIVATCSSVGEARSIASSLKSIGITAHVLEEATSNIGVPGIPVSGTVMVPDSDVLEAQRIIQRNFPSQRGSGIKICDSCIDKKSELKRIGTIFSIWIALQEAFFFRSFCPRCRRFY